MSNAAIVPDPVKAAIFQFEIDVIKAIRSIKAEYGIPASTIVRVAVVGRDGNPLYTPA